MTGTWRSGPAAIWRGFEHRWLRRVAGMSTPHRISKLASFVDGEHEPGFNFAQATGVDGNFMRPVGHYGLLTAPGLSSVVQRVTFQLSDMVSGRPPMAQVDAVQEIEPPSPTPNQGEIIALLNGFSLRSRCLHALQPDGRPCNSDGFWPVKLAVGVHQGASSTQPARVHVSVHRAWTPMLGGLPPVEVKPLNQRLDFEIDVYVALVHAPGLGIQAHHTLSSRGPLQRSSAMVQRAPTAALGLTGWGFTLPELAKRGPRTHRGRYLDEIAFWLRGGPEPALCAQVHAPLTVVPGEVECTLAAVELDGCTISPSRVEGRLCFNSTEQAPFFSRWRGCDDPKRGPACDHQRIKLAVRPQG